MAYSPTLLSMLQGLWPTTAYYNIVMAYTFMDCGPSRPTIYSYGLYCYGLWPIAPGLWPAGHALHCLVVSVCRAADAQPIVIEETTAAAFEALLHFVYSDALVVDDELLVAVLRHGHVCSHVYTYVSDLVPH